MGDEEKGGEVACLYRPAVTQAQKVLPRVCAIIHTVIQGAAIDIATAYHSHAASALDWCCASVPSMTGKAVLFPPVPGCYIGAFQGLDISCLVLLRHKVDHTVPVLGYTSNAEAALAREILTARHRSAINSSVPMPRDAVARS